MKLSSDARTLKKKALSSLRSSVAAFNGLSDDGRETTVLLHLQHAFEMLLKAALSQKKVTLFDKATGRSISFEASIRQAQQTTGVKLTAEESGTLRVIDAMRDDEQHWYNFVDEALLYVHIRAAVTLFDDILHRVFEERLADHLPRRILPVSTEPPQDFQVLVDKEYSTVAQLLQPGRRAGAEARARIRTLLAMEAHNEPDTQVSDKDVVRVEKGVRDGKSRAQVFPRLSGVGAMVTGDGIEVEVRFVKNGGLPVTYVADDAEVDAAAVRTIDLTKKYHRSAFSMADDLKMSRPRGAALRAHLAIDADPRLTHTFAFNSQKAVRFSDLAYIKMQEALKTVDMAAIWKSHRAVSKGTPLPPCSEPGCIAVLPELAA